MHLSELIPLLQRVLDEHGDMLVGWDNEGRLYSFDADDIEVMTGVNYLDTAPWKNARIVACNSRMLILGRD